MSTYQMDLISLLCGEAYLDPAKYNDLQTPYIQVEYDPYCDLAPSWDYSLLHLLYWFNDDHLQTHRQNIWAFHSWPLPWNFLPSKVRDSSFMSWKVVLWVILDKTLSTGLALYITQKQQISQLGP